MVLHNAIVLILLPKEYVIHANYVTINVLIQPKIAKGINVVKTFLSLLQVLPNIIANAMTALLIIAAII